MSQVNLMTALRKLHGNLVVLMVLLMAEVSKQLRLHPWKVRKNCSCVFAKC